MCEFGHFEEGASARTQISSTGDIRVNSERAHTEDAGVFQARPDTCIECKAHEDYEAKIQAQPDAEVH